MRSRIWLIRVSSAKEPFGQSFELNIRARSYQAAAVKGLREFRRRARGDGSAEKFLKRPFVSLVKLVNVLDD